MVWAGKTSVNIEGGSITSITGRSGVDWVLDVARQKSRVSRKTSPRAWQEIFPPLTFNIAAPSADLIYQKSVLPYYPGVLPRCLRGDI